MTENWILENLANWVFQSSDLVFLFLHKKNPLNNLLMFFLSRHVTHSVGFFSECQTAEDWMKAKEEILNNRFSVSEFKLEEGEALHKEMQELRDELSAYEDEVTHRQS